MALKLGTTDISKVYVGDTVAQKVYLGSTEVWSNSVPIEYVGISAFSGGGCSRTVSVTVPSDADCAVVLTRVNDSGGISASFAGSSMTSMANSGTMAVFGFLFAPGTYGATARTVAVNTGHCVAFSTFTSMYCLFFKNVKNLGTGTTGSGASVGVTAPEGSMAVGVWAGAGTVGPTQRFNVGDSAFNWYGFCGGHGLVQPGNTSVTMTGPATARAVATLLN
ncbi:hypothetical protein KIV63_gp07 [Mycobacterium phage SWU2]|uniref:Uncharacterized protein n=1 Tax=Mycobacterium phage SWU2 TaxID=2077150 RepID=A0A2K9VHX6_9CAUD|nr:hypothetical protein KIV63_gp07 [Mycobacterium phage SWU2]AUV61966.1 hypothetical protein JX_gp07 [Mycobacterium phage SWU2]